MTVQRRAALESRKKFWWIRNKWRAAKNLAFIHGPGRRFRRFEASLHPETWARHGEFLAWAESMAAEREIHEAPERYEASSDPVVRQGYDLVQKVKREFKDRCRDHHELRILIHVPPASASSAYASLGANFVQSFQFLGIAARGLEWSDDTREVLESFRPTLLMSVDHEGHLNQIDWEAVREYRRGSVLRLGLVAQLQEYGNTLLGARLRWADEHEVDFYYSSRDPEYLTARYQEILKRGYRIFHLECGANPLCYYPVPGVARELRYVFLGSTNPDKWRRYYSYFGPLGREHPGYIDGPWWRLISRFGASDTHRYLCARARVALNLHIANQMEWACELNERTYNLAACGVPQLVDRPKLLSARFGPECFFVADTPADYEALFAFILSNAEEAQRRALQAQREVFANHTVFHHAERFITAFAQSGLVTQHETQFADHG